ncbi:MAG: hypothetical protein KC535_02700 [Nanoarchaeota archaeon]|nr:hypothetical protein [Nanoarchaeota archaeon]
MFEELEKEARDELKRLYSDYITDKTDSTLEKRGLLCEQKYAGVATLSKEVTHAGWKASDLALKELDVEEAKKILETLQ